MDIEKLKEFIEAFLENQLMRSFVPNPDNHPDVIYKYRNWKDEHHKNLLIKNELYSATPGSLNDPFDCRIFKNYIKALETEESKENYISASLLRNSKYFLENNISIGEAESRLRERIADSLHYQIRGEYTHENLSNKFVGIICFSEVWNSILMWTHYSDSHKGYCVGFDEKRLRLFQDGRLQRVNYSNDYPEIDPLVETKNSAEIKYFYKSDEWKYEQEIRLMKIFPTDTNQNYTDRRINFDNKLVKEIILGLQTEKFAKQEIIAIAKDKGIPVWQTVKAEFQFKIERYQL